MANFSPPSETNLLVLVVYMERDSARGANQPGLKILARFFSDRAGIFSPAKQGPDYMSWAGRVSRAALVRAGPVVM